MKHLLFPFMLMALLSLPVSAQYDNGARYAFLASSDEMSVVIVDLHQQEVAKQIDFSLAPTAVVASNDMKALVVAHRDKKQLTLIDLADEKLTQLNYPLTLSPDDIKLSPLGDTVAIYDRHKKLVEIQSLRRKQAVLTVNQVDTGTPLTFSLDGSHIYWVDQQTGSLNVTDLWSKAGKLKLTSKGQGLSAMSRSVDGSLGFVSDALVGKVYVIDLKTMTKIKDIYVGRRPGRAWGTTDGSMMLIPNGGDSSLTAISSFTLEPLFTVQGVAEPVAVNTGWLDTTAAIIGKNGELVLINLTTGEVVERHRFKGTLHEGVVTSDSKMLAVSVERLGSLALFDMSSRSLIKEISGLPSDIGGAALAISNNQCH